MKPHFSFDVLVVQLYFSQDVLNEYVTMARHMAET